MEKTVLEKKFDWLVDENIPGESFLDFAPFMVKEESLPSNVRNEFLKGSKCVWTKKKHPFFNHTTLLTFKGKNECHRDRLVFHKVGIIT